MHKMRRADRQLGQSEVNAIIANGEYLTLATISADGTPYVTALSYAVIDGDLYFHSAKEGHKCENIANNPNVSLSVVTRSITLPEAYSVDYASVTAFGKCTLVTDNEMRKAVAVALVDKYSASVPKRHEYAEQYDTASYYKIEIAHATGKANA